MPKSWTGACSRRSAGPFNFIFSTNFLWRSSTRIDADGAQNSYLLHPLLSVSSKSNEEWKVAHLGKFWHSIIRPTVIWSETVCLRTRPVWDQKKSVLLAVVFVLVLHVWCCIARWRETLKVHFLKHHAPDHGRRGRAKMYICSYNWSTTTKQTVHGKPPWRYACFSVCLLRLIRRKGMGPGSVCPVF